MVKKILAALFFVLVIGWLVILFIDYNRVRVGEKPKFCIQHTIYDYVDGSVEECVGLGYKSYMYDRDSYSANEFGPIWIKQHKSEID